MDQRTIVSVTPTDASTMQERQAAAAEQFRIMSLYIDGCIDGLVPDLAAETVSPGWAFKDGDLLRLLTAADIDLAGVTRPASGEFVWVAIEATYTQQQVGTVVDGITQTQYSEEINDSIMISLKRGTDTTSSDSNDAERPDISEGAIVLCDVLFDHDTALGSLTNSASRRPKCPADDLQDQLDEHAAALRLLQADAAATRQPPNKMGAVTLTSTTALEIDASWSAGTVPSGAPAIDRYRTQWRRMGDQWVTANLNEVGTALEDTITVPDADSAIQVRVAARNTNGWGEWSDATTIASGDIMSGPPLQTQSFGVTGSPHTFSWPFPNASRARITVRGGGGGNGGQGGRLSTVASASFCTSCDGWSGSNTVTQPTAGRDGSSGGASQVERDGSVIVTASGGDGGDGGDGGNPPESGRAGEAGTTSVIDIVGLTEGEELIITVGAKGSGGRGGNGGRTVIHCNSCDKTSNHPDGSDGSDGSNGSVTIEPLT